MRMIWHDLLFAHWPMEADALRGLVPQGMELDTFEAQAWIGIVPFRMTGVSHRLLPDLPWVSAFPEINVRTYVRVGGVPGVLFLSLDATNPLAVVMARAVYHLPYHRATIDCREVAGRIEYASRRRDRSAGPAEFVADYGPVGRWFHAVDGSLNHFLVERYSLFTTDRRGRVLRGDIHHAPWPLQEATCELRINTIARPLGLELPDAPPLLHFAKRLDVVAWRLRPC
jgi:uncharacterized protein YqjF (DUF2071 family)